MGVEQYGLVTWAGGPSTIRQDVGLETPDPGLECRPSTIEPIFEVLGDELVVVQVGV
jgi:hypothetical protein